MSADTAFAIAIQVTIGAWLLLAAIGKVQNLDRTYRAMAAYPGSTERRRLTARRRPVGGDQL